MKKRLGLFVFLFLILMLNVVLISALTEDEENTKVDSAYNCLINKINNTDCSRLSLTEATFSLLAVNMCADKVKSSASTNLTCWPSSSCNLKTTAQAILALSNQGYTTETENAEKWLMSQNSTPTNLVWYLEIDSNDATTCTLKYGSGTYNINIDSNKKIDKNAGTCLTRAQNNNWFEINKNCLKNEFQISCNKNFVSTLLFKNQSSDTIHVMQSTHSASAGGTTIEQITALCFSKAGTCDYEGSLWASIILNKKGYDISKFMPYLIGSADGNPQYLPEAFLYTLTDSIDYKTTVMQKQIMNKYWMVGTDKYYDTAVAMYPFQLETFDEKTATKSWLLTEVQQSDGCWNNDNVLDTAFILNAIWPRPFGNGGATNVSNFTGGGNDYSCTENGFYCTSSASCSTSNLKEGYECPGVNVCCKVNPMQTCSEMKGIICNSNQWCDGTEFSTDDLLAGQKCCVDGACKLTQGTTTDTCTPNSGVCGESCNSGYEETNLYTCSLDTDKCCVSSTTGGGTITPPTTTKSKLWIWILVVLIVLVLIAIIFREKIKQFLIKMKSGKKKDGPGSSFGGPRPSEFPMYPRPMPGPRRIIPSQPPQRMPSRNAPQSSRELDDVLKKLKDMSK